MIDRVDARGLARDREVVARVLLDPRLDADDRLLLAVGVADDPRGEVAVTLRQLRRELQVPGERWRVRVRPGQQPQERCRHDGHLRHDRVHHPLVQQEGRADRAVPVHLQTAAREVDLLRARGSEQDVRLRLRHVERLHDLVGERRWERGLDRRYPGSKDCVSASRLSADEPVSEAVQSEPS
jgi:hypothetical protein